MKQAVTNLSLLQQVAVFGADCVRSVRLRDGSARRRRRRLAPVGRVLANVVALFFFVTGKIN